MDRTQAVHIIEETFKNSFDDVRFTHFVRNLFNEIDEGGAFTIMGNDIPEAYKDHIKMYKRIAKYTDPDNNELDILIVNLKKDSSIERARSMQRNFLAWYLKNRGEKDAALVAYYTEDWEDWRFSFVRMDYYTEKNSKGKIRAITDLTPARRYSFLVGKNEPNHTAQQQLVPLLEDTINNPSLSQIEQAFNIESVTKEFFNKYRLLFDNVNEHIEKEIKKSKQLRDELTSKGIDAASFSKKLLGQIVFLYFIQKKGWLGVPKDQTWGKGDRQFLRTLLQEAISKKENFYSEYLEYLFYEALAKEHRGGSDASYYPKFDCKIPFLNGGLFEADYDWKRLEITLSNSFFTNTQMTDEGDIGDGILDIFDRYNFTVKEDEPMEKEVAVDPEMLGKVFENLLEVKDRKGKGAFYTPREIVHYMCQESLINYLDVTINRQTVNYTKLGDNQIDAFGNQANRGQLSFEQESMEVIIPRKEIKDFIRHGSSAIENDLHIETIVKETEKHGYKIPASIRENAKRLDKALEDIRICDPAIGSGAFPVGIMNEIVQARQILQTYTKNKITAYDLKRHAIQVCIYGVDIDHSAIDVAKLRLWLSLVVDEDDFYKIKPLPNLDYKIICGDSLKKIELDLFNSDLCNELEEIKPLFFDEVDSKSKKDYRKRIEILINKITKGKNTFDFRVHFSEVFHKKGGFDVVIANPPYGVKVTSENRGKYTTSFGPVPDFEIFYWFLSLAADLTHPSGQLAYIIPNTFFFNMFAKKFRRIFIEKWMLRDLVDLTPMKVFESAEVKNCMVICQRSEKIDYQTRISVFGSSKNYEIALLKSVMSSKNELIDAVQNWQPLVMTGNEADKLLRKIDSVSIPLNDILDAKQGYIPYRKTTLIKRFGAQKAQRILAERQWHASSKETKDHKKELQGKDVKRYSIDWSGVWVRYGEWVSSYVDLKYFSEPRLLFREITCPPPYALVVALSDETFVNNPSVITAIQRQNKSYNLKFLLGLCNSKLLSYYFISHSPKARKGLFPKIIVNDVRNLPIIKLSQNDQRPIISIVDRILKSKEKNIEKDITSFEIELNNLVYELYGLTKQEIEMVESSSIRD